MPEFTTATGVIYYEEMGPAQPRAPLLLLHNFMSTGRTAWGNIAGELAKEYRVILPDLPGHGRSVGYPPHFDHRTMAVQMADLVQSLDLFTLHIAGCSAGGALAEWMVAEELLDVRTLTLVSSSYSVSPETTGEPIDTRPEAYRAGANWLEVTAKLHDSYQGEGYFERELLPGYRALTPATSIDLQLDSLATWDLPVCIIHGQEDEIFPVALAEQMHATLPNSELHVIPRQAHSLIFRKSRQVSAIMQEFLAKHSD
ncbi:MAG: alpha/beta hydrolase [Caldilineaceae bacterium]|nr:alpha/beta hydrolase [Caldilineaceae bacterium]